MSSSKNIDLWRDFAVGVYQSLQTGDTVSYVGIFDPTMWTVNYATVFVTFSLVQFSSLPPFLCE